MRNRQGIFFIFLFFLFFSFDIKKELLEYEYCDSLPNMIIKSSDIILATVDYIEEGLVANIIVEDVLKGKMLKGQEIEVTLRSHHGSFGGANAPSEASYTEGMKVIVFLIKHKNYVTTDYQCGLKEEDLNFYKKIILEFVEISEIKNIQNKADRLVDWYEKTLFFDKMMIESIRSLFAIRTQSYQHRINIVLRNFFIDNPLVTISKFDHTLSLNRKTSFANRLINRIKKDKDYELSDALIKILKKNDSEKGFYSYFIMDKIIDITGWEALREYIKNGLREYVKTKNKSKIIDEFIEAYKVEQLKIIR